MMSIENYKKKLESMSQEELLHEISNLINDHGIQLQNKNIELQELKMALARADLQLQFQIGEVDLRDKEIESLKGKRKPEDNEVLNILDKLSEIAYKEGCAKDVLKVIDYINWQKAEIERLTEEKDRYQEKWQTAYMNELNFQKQVDELKLELQGQFDKGVKAGCLMSKVKEKQTVKDMAKEIISLLEDMDKRGMKVPFSIVLRGWLKEQYGVEVE